MKRFLGPVLIMLIVAAPAWSQEVVVGGQVVMRLQDAASAKAATRRIDALIARGADARSIGVTRQGRSWSVVWGKTVLATASPRLARADKSMPRGLATAWATHLKRVIGLGLLRAVPSSLTLPVGGQATVKLDGVATGSIKVGATDGLVKLSQTSPNQLLIKARAVGKTRLIVERGKATTGIPVHVKDRAGYPPKTAAVQVTGRPAPGPMVARAALACVKAQTRLNPGCKLKLGGPLPELPAVPPGRTLKFSLPITIAGNANYYPVHERVAVRVSTLELKPVESNLLLVSNRPERVDKDGILLKYTFSRSDPCRLMYSHLNASKTPRNLWINLVNPDPQPVRVLVESTYAGPSRNEVRTGHAAAIRFLTALGKGAGYVVTIRGHGRFALASHTLDPKELVSGFASLRILDGKRLEAEVLSALAPAADDDRGMPLLGGTFNPFKIHPHGVFAQPYFERWVECAPTTVPKRLAVGKSPWLIDFQTGLPNTGNFGVIYHYHITLTNPTRRPVSFQLCFDPASGPAAGTFLVNDQVQDVDFTEQPTPIGNYLVQPGAKRKLDLVTLPEASSHYPAYIDVTEAGP